MTKIPFGVLEEGDKKDVPADCFDGGAIDVSISCAQES